MAMHVSPPLSFKSTNFMALSSSLCNKPPSPVFSSRSLRSQKKVDPLLGCVLLHQTRSSGSRNSNFQTLNRRSHTGYLDFSGNNILEQIEELRKRLNVSIENSSMKNPIFDRAMKNFPAAAAEVGILECCSVNKAFSSLVFMIGEIQSHALHIREHLTREDLPGIVTKMHRETVTSFVWLFQQVFAQTPTLMVFVMILMANYTVHSMTRDAAAAAATAYGSSTVMGSEKRRKEPLPWEREVSRKEVSAWNSLMEDAMLLHEQQMGGFGLDKETKKPYISPLTMEVEEDDDGYEEEYVKTDLIYQMGLVGDPDNALLLANYAQFLYLVAQDIERAEECFKRAIMGEPPDADALSSYADFLWIVKKDLLEAEEKYQQALEIDPNNFHLASRYAHFLWKTAGIDTFIVPQQQEDGDTQ